MKRSKAMSTEDEDFSGKYFLEDLHDGADDTYHRMSSAAYSVKCLGLSPKTVMKALGITEEQLQEAMTWDGRIRPEEAQKEPIGEPTLTIPAEEE
jgi:hypothetical protein